MRSWRVAVAVLLLSTSAIAAPPKKEVPADIDSAEQLLTRLDYEGANAAAEKIVKLRGLSHDNLLRAYKVLAITSAVLDNEKDAREAFLQVLIMEPEYQVDQNLGPKVTDPFREARGSFRAMQTKPALEASATVQTSGGTIRVTTRDPTKLVKKVSVGYRWTSSGEFTVSQVAPGEGISVEVAAAPAGRTRLDFYAQGLDERDSALLEAGNPLVPKSAFAAVDPSGTKGDKGGGGGSIFGSPVFWVITGVVVAGGATAAFFALRPNDPATHAQLSPVILCGSARCQ